MQITQAVYRTALQKKKWMWGVLKSHCAFLCSAEVTESMLNGVIVFCVDFTISPSQPTAYLDIHAGSEVGNRTYHTPTA